MIEEGVSPDKVVVFPNYVTKEWLSFERSGTYGMSPKKIAIVSNHVPPELIEARELLTQQGCEVDIYGLGFKVSLITPEVLNEYDLVITIGKTVQYAMTLRLPVYCYDMHGGPGYLSAEELDRAAFYNFSGRGFPKKSAQVIAEEVIGQYGNNLEMLPELLDFIRETSILENNIEDVWAAIENTDNVNISGIIQKHAYIERNNMALIRMFSERSVFQNLNGEIQKMHRTLENIVNSRSWKITAPLRKFMEIIHSILHKNKDV